MGLVGVVVVTVMVLRGRERSVPHPYAAVLLPSCV